MIEVIEDSDYLVVSLHEMKTHLKIEHEELNDVLINYIKLATRFVERMIGKSFLIKTYRYYWKQFLPTPMYQSIKMPITPIKEVVGLIQNPNRTRIRRYSVEIAQYILIQECYTDVEFIYKAGMALHPKDIDDEYKHLVRMVAQAMFEEKDLETHPCMKVLQCYKNNSCTSL